MKTIGLIGGMSYESTITYYKVINETVNNKLGDLNSAQIILYSFNFAEIESYQATNQWGKSAEALINAAQTLEKAKADFIVICTNTMHKIADDIQKQLKIDILHIADATADSLIEHNIHNVALLGTKYTMKEDFYKDKLKDHNINVLVPNDSDIEIVNSIIYNELCKGILKESSKQEYIRIIDKLKNQGAEAVILGCTEIGLLINEENSPLKVFDTALIHAEKAALLSIE